MFIMVIEQNVKKVVTQLFRDRNRNGIGNHSKHFLAQTTYLDSSNFAIKYDHTSKLGFSLYKYNSSIAGGSR